MELHSTSIIRTRQQAGAPARRNLTLTRMDGAESRAQVRCPSAHQVGQLRCTNSEMNVQTANATRTQAIVLIARADARALTIASNLVCDLPVFLFLSGVALESTLRRWLKVRMHGRVPVDVRSSCGSYHA